MSKNGIKSRVLKKFKATTNFKHKLPVVENTLNREFTVDKPNEKMVSNITYLRKDEGWPYIAGKMDLCGQKIIGLSMSERMTKELVINALNNGYRRMEDQLLLFYTLIEDLDTAQTTINY